MFNGVRAKKIVTAGRLVPQKNYDILIRAFKEVSKEFPEYTLTIYGNGDERAKLENLICNLELREKVLLPGATKDLFNEIIDAEIFVLSPNFEGMPNALIEAMALGIPCISTDCPSGGPRSLIKNMHNGILVTVNEVDEMVKAIKLILTDRKKSQKISTEAVKVRVELDKDRICNRWADYIKQL